MKAANFTNAPSLAPIPGGLTVFLTAGWAVLPSGGEANTTHAPSLPPIPGSAIIHGPTPLQSEDCGIRQTSALELISGSTCFALEQTWKPEGNLNPAVDCDAIEGRW